MLSCASRPCKAPESRRSGSAAPRHFRFPSPTRVSPASRPRRSPRRPERKTHSSELGRTAAGAYRLDLPLAVLACALAPAYTVGWHIGFYPNLLEIGILLTVVVFAWESYQQRRMPTLLGPTRIFLVATALLVVAGALSVIVAPDRKAALGLYRAYFIEPVLFFV